jgi:urea transporter
MESEVHYRVHMRPYISHFLHVFYAPPITSPFVFVALLLVLGEECKLRHLAQDKHQWRALVDTVKKLRVP